MIRTIASLVIVGLACTSCGKQLDLKLPQVKLLRQETTEEKAGRRIDSLIRSEDQATFFRELASLMEFQAREQLDNVRLLKLAMDRSAQIQEGDRLARLARMIELLPIPRAAVVEEAAGRLPQATGAQAKLCRILLQMACPPAPGRSPDFSLLARWLRTSPDCQTNAAVLWMYEHDPEASLEQMLRLHRPAMSVAETQTILFAARAVDQYLWKLRWELVRDGQPDLLAIQQLENLCQSDWWWVRLYVAEILTRYPALRTGTMLSKLRNDRHPLVVSVIQQTGTP